MARHISMLRLACDSVCGPVTYCLTVADIDPVLEVKFRLDDANHGLQSAKHTRMKLGCEGAWHAKQ